MIGYQIGTLAEKIVSVRIGLDGTVMPYVRRRQANGRMVDVPEKAFLRAHNVTQTEFVVRVSPGHNGAVMLDPGKWFFPYPVAIIPLGKADPFLPGELGEGVAAPRETFAAAEEVHFRLADNRLTWEAENVSGQATINETYPELSVTLRLPPGNEGAFEFALPLFARTNGSLERLLAAA